MDSQSHSESLAISSSNCVPSTEGPSSADARTTKTVGEVVGIPVLNFDPIVEDLPYVSENESEVSEMQAQEPEDDEGWTKVSGKSRFPSSSPKAASSSDMMQLTMDDVQSEINYWSTAVVCYVLGGNPPWELLSGFVNRLWGKYKYDKVSFLPNGAFLVHFPTLECKNLVLQQGFPMFNNKPLVVKSWTEDCSLTKERVKYVPIWIRLCGLPLKFWGASSLEKLSSLVGKFMRCDTATMEKTRLGYARLMVEVEVGQQFLDSLYFKDEKDCETSVAIEYEWRPDVCSLCKGIGHVSDICKKPTVSQPTVTQRKVWRPVVRTQPKELNPVRVPSTAVASSSVAPAVTSPLRESPRVAATIASPVTIVTSLGVSNIQHHPGGRVWLVWLDQFFNVQVFGMSDQHITLYSHRNCFWTTFLFTVVYGSNDEDDRLSLWADLKRIKDVYSGPWAICGDFNNLLDVNERIGRPVLWSDIEDFRDCVFYCEVMDVKAQGSFFTWNNKHEPTTRVFSRLDRFMVNSDWLNIYPDCYAYFLPEGLFDHNPCVITKQQKLKGPSKQLNRNRFSDVEKAVEIARLRLIDLQTAMHRYPTNLITLEAESIASNEFRHLTKAHFSYLSRKAKVAWLLRQVNITTLTLIPKVKNLVSVLEYRPIACCNIIYKCITKIFCSRLSEVLPDIVSCSQGSFVKGRNIVDNVLICQDLVRLYNRKTASPRCLIKIDLRKAYDTVEWEFIHQILNALKFPTRFINLIMVCVSSPSYSLHVNGSTFGYFQGKRGLRQGDPLSPLLFTLAMEYLSRILHVVSLQDTFRFHPMCGHIKLNHLLFADDLLMFCKGNAASIMWLLRYFSTFSAASGLCLNRDKSDIYFNGVLGDIIEDIVKISGFRIGKLLFNYLGVPISTKKISEFDSQKLIERIVARIRALGARHLSYSRCLILLNSDKPYTADAGYNWIRYKTGKVPWRFVCWNSLNVPKTSFIFWAAQQNRLLTLDRVLKMGMGHDSTCFICGLEPETHPHLFYKCVYSTQCILLLQDKLNIYFNMDEMVCWFSKNRAASPLQKLITGACYVGVTYAIRTVRNQARLLHQVTVP
ncbi:uncharacterized protein LOC141655393 [Silene latifolia]|uniref:uncharacterized protein LOC141655393 n=1 Tax=Silene latifolia TaxID=37657 RepID=UPI003D76CC2A